MAKLKCQLEAKDKRIATLEQAVEGSIGEH
jgi:hypothetical protein